MSAPTIAADPILERVTRAIADRIRPIRISLFGSRSRGDAREDSDYDLMVVVDDQAGADVEGAIRETIRTLKDGGVRGDSKTFVGSRQGALTGSIFSEIPVVLVEMVTLTNARDAEFIKSEEGQSLMARAIGGGIDRYLAR